MSSTIAKPLRGRLAGVIGAAAMAGALGLTLYPESCPAAIVARTLSASQLVDVTAQVRVAVSGITYSRATGIYSGTLSVGNPSAVSSVSGPLALYLGALTSGVTQTNATGLYNGFPYTLQNLSLAPGGSISITLQFSNPANGKIAFTPAVYQTGPAAFLATATNYQPQQSLASYEPAPGGFTPIFTQAVVRHGSRGQSSFNGAAYNMYLQAQTDGALTTLGGRLGPDLMAMIKANTLLGAGNPGITTPGYGNLSQTGISEQQQIAARLLQRLPAYFDGLPAAGRQIVYVGSGVNRAMDSAGFFVGSLAANKPALQPWIVKTAALTAYPVNKPVAQAAGVNRFLLYFHKVAAKTDLVTSPSDPYFQTYQEGLTYQSYLASTNLLAKVSALSNTAQAIANARTVLEGLFSPAFVDKIANGTYKFYNSGSFTFSTDNSSYTGTVTGDNSLTIQSLTDAVNELYSYYTSAPSLSQELGNLDFSVYIPAARASVLAYLDDVDSFYKKGPGIAEDGDATYRMAKILLDDFFNEVDAIARGDLSHGAKLRFTHAEEIIPLASILELKNVNVPVPRAADFRYDSNPWRGSMVAPYAANVQWDVYRNSGGTLLLKMLYNEKETDFKAACDSARFAAGSHFYDYGRLKTCYGRVPN